MRVDLGYVAIMAASIAAGLLVRRLVPAEGPTLARLPRLALLAGLVIGGTLGAKLPFLLSDPEGALSGAAYFSDGRTLTWGLVGGYFGVELAKRLAGVRVKTGDGFAVPVAVSIAFGRIGCFYAGCCYGAATTMPWGVDIGDGVSRHPSPLYEAAFHVSAAAALFAIGKKGWLRTQRIKVYLIAYMLFRVISETWRPEPRLALGLTFYQWSSLAFALLFALLYVHDARRLGYREATAPAPP